jgi:hypothetical protein
MYIDGMKNGCPTCGSTSTQPNGQVMHRFEVGSRVRSFTGMHGTVVGGPVRHNGFKVEWDNGHTGWFRTVNMEHEEG